MEKMLVTDLYGKSMQITNLPEAIRQAALYKEFRHVDTRFRNLDRELSAYWKDMHQKLLRLQTTSQGNESPTTL